MKNVIIAVALAAVLAVGGFGFHQHRLLTDTKARLAELENQLQAANEALEAQTAAAEKAVLAERKARVLQETLTQSSQVSAQQSQQVSQLEASLAATKTNSTGLAALLNDPDMKEMIRAQQTAVMGTVIEKSYGEFFKQLNLTPEQKEHIKGLLEKKMLTGSEMGMSMLGGSMDAEKRKELTQQIKKETDAMDLALKEYLGEENYKTFQEYEKTLPDRMSLDQLKDQLSGSGATLDPQQEKQLIDVMSQERQSFKWTTDYNNQNPGEADLSQMFSEERMTRHFEEQAAYNRQLLERSRTFLRHDQLAALERSLESQRKMQEAAMKMAGKMFNSPPK